jgi:hypothetical protein
MTRIILTLLTALVLMSAPARADYGDARAAFDDLTRRERASVTLGLIASGDFEGLAAQGFTERLYRAIRDFEQREGFIADGVLEPEQVQRLTDMADDFYRQLGARTYDHPDTDARLLVPRGLFDAEKETPEGLLFTRRDGMLSLVFLSIPRSEKSYDALWNSLSAESGGKRIVYERHFENRFVVTGFFHQSKFYTMMARTGSSTSGFTFSWGAPFEELGRKVSTFLANAYLAEFR